MGVVHAKFRSIRNHEHCNRGYEGALDIRARAPIQQLGTRAFHAHSATGGSCKRQLRYQVGTDGGRRSDNNARLAKEQEEHSSKAREVTFWGRQPR